MILVGEKNRPLIRCLVQNLQMLHAVCVFGNICVTNYPEYVPFVVNTSRSFPRSWLIIGFVTRLTRRAPPVEQELFTLPENLSSSPVFSEVHVTPSLVLCVGPFILFLLPIILSVLRFTDSDYLFGIFKLLICMQIHSWFDFPLIYMYYHNNGQRIETIMLNLFQMDKNDMQQKWKITQKSNIVWKTMVFSRHSIYQHLSYKDKLIHLAEQFQIQLE